MAYYIRSTTIVRGNTHAAIMREIAYSEDTEQTIVKTKQLGKTEVKCYEEVLDGDQEEEIYAEYMVEGDWENIPAQVFNSVECTSFEEVNDENRGVVIRSKKHNHSRH